MPLRHCEGQLFPAHITAKIARAIRIVTLQPGVWDSPIQYDLSIHYLTQNNIYELSHYYSSSIAYEALSYGWGFPGEAKEQEILLSGQPFKVRKKLFEALHHLRSPDINLFL